MLFHLFFFAESTSSGHTYVLSLPRKEISRCLKKKEICWWNMCPLNHIGFIWIFYNRNNINLFHWYSDNSNEVVSWSYKQIIDQKSQIYIWKTFYQFHVFHNADKFIYHGRSRDDGFILMKNVKIKFRNSFTKLRGTLVTNTFITCHKNLTSWTYPCTWGQDSRAASNY